MLFGIHTIRDDERVDGLNYHGVDVLVGA